MPVTLTARLPDEAHATRHRAGRHTLRGMPPATDPLRADGFASPFDGSALGQAGLANATHMRTHIEGSASWTTGPYGQGVNRRRGVLMWRRVALAIGSMALVGACTSTTESALVPTSAFTQGHSPSPAKSSPSPSSTSHVSAAEPASGGEYDEVRLLKPGDSGPGRVHVPLWLMDTGDMVVTVNPTPAGEKIGQSRVGVRSQSGTVLFDVLSTPQPNQAIVAASAKGVVVWLETSSTDMWTQPWRVLRATVGHQQSTLVGDSVAMFGDTNLLPPPGVQLLATDGFTAWWTVTYPDDASANGHGVKVVGRALSPDAGPMFTAADRAYLPVIAGGRLVVARTPTVDPRGHASSYSIVTLTPTGEQVVARGSLGQGDSVLSMCGSEHLLAWAISSSEEDHNGRLVVRDLSSGAEFSVALDDQAQSTQLGCGDGIVAWGNGSGNGDASQYVLDTSSRAIKRVGESPGISTAYVAGRMVAWTLPPAVGEAATTKVVRWR